MAIARPPEQRPMTPARRSAKSIAASPRADDPFFCTQCVRRLGGRTAHGRGSIIASPGTKRVLVTRCRLFAQRVGVERSAAKWARLRYLWPTYPLILIR